MGKLSASGDHRVIDRGASVLLGCFACSLLILGVGGWSSQASWASAQTSTIATTSVGPAWIEPPELLTTHEENVSAGAYLELVAFVHQPDGTPVKSASVLFDWDAQRGRCFTRETTNSRGIARVRRWVSTAERGHTNRIRVSVDTPTWSAERYAWFVPE